MSPLPKNPFGSPPVIREHYSAKTGKWEVCTANRGACPYNSNLHRDTEGLEAFPQSSKTAIDLSNPSSWPLKKLNPLLADSITEKLGGPYGEKKLRLVATLASWNGKVLSFAGKFTHGDDPVEVVGTFHRYVTPGVEAHNENIDVDKEFRSQGFTQEFLFSTEEWYHELGCKEIHSAPTSSINHANSARTMVGAYVWAKMGYYQWEEKPYQILNRAQELLADEELSSSERSTLTHMLKQFESKDPEQWPTPLSVAYLGKANSLGKRLLIANVNWSGIRKI